VKLFQACLPATEGAARRKTNGKVENEANVSGTP
jgi:hypothetical protein